jgi:hypothetical protein
MLGSSGWPDAEDMLEAGVRVARRAGFDAVGRGIEADRKTAEIIVATAAEEAAPLIVMDQRGRSASKRRGSVWAGHPSLLPAEKLKGL